VVIIKFHQIFTIIFTNISYSKILLQYFVFFFVFFLFIFYTRFSDADDTQDKVVPQGASKYVIYKSMSREQITEKCITSIIAGLN